MATTMEHAFARAMMRGPAGRLREYAEFSFDRAEAGERAEERAVDVTAMNRCRKYARDAMKEANDNIIKAKGLFLEYLMDDAPALNELMNVNGAVHKRATEYLNRIWQEHHPAATRSGGHGPRDAQPTGAPRNGGGATIGDVKPITSVSPAAPSPAQQKAAIKAMNVRAESWFASEIIRGRPIGDITYGEMERSASISLNDGISNLRQAYLQRRLFRSVPYNPALRDVPAKEWADEQELKTASDRWNELMSKVPQLTVEELENILKIEESE